MFLSFDGDFSDGLILRAARVLRGLTLANLSELTGLDISLISRIERGQRRLTPNSSARIAAALGTRGRR